MLEFLRSAILNYNPNIPKDTTIDWDKLMDITAGQNVLAWVWDGICKLPIDQQPPRQYRINWGLSVQGCWDEYSKQKSVLSELIQVCQNNDMRLLLLKGYDLSLLYPKPQSRPSSDIDIYLFNDYDKGNDLFGSSAGVFNHKHTSFDYHGVHVENHLTPIDTDTFYQKRVEEYLESNMSEVVESKYGYWTFPAISNLVYLTTHAIRHFRLDDLIPLRIFVDIAFFIRAYKDKIDVEECERVMKKLEIDKSLSIFVVIAQEMLGLDVPRIITYSIPRKDAQLAKWCFLEGLFEKDPPYEIRSMRSLGKQWNWYFRYIRLYKYIPKTFYEKYMDFKHQVGITTKAIRRIVKGKDNE